MSEELLHEETQNEGTPVTMADLEEHFDDANPWNVVKSYMEKGTVLPVKVEGIVNGGAIAMVEGLRGSPGIPDYLSPISKILKLTC